MKEMLIEQLFYLSFLLTFLGTLGLFCRWNNIIVTLICLEIILLSIAFMFLIASFYLDDIIGQIIYLYLITLAGIEVSIGLSLLILYYRLRGIISIKFLSFLKG